MLNFVIFNKLEKNNFELNFLVVHARHIKASPYLILSFLNNTSGPNKFYKKGLTCWKLPESVTKMLRL